MVRRQRQGPAAGRLAPARTLSTSTTAQASLCLAAPCHSPADECMLALRLVARRSSSSAMRRPCANDTVESLRRASFRARMRELKLGLTLDDRYAS